MVFSYLFKYFEDGRWFCSSSGRWMVPDLVSARLRHTVPKFRVPHATPEVGYLRVRHLDTRFLFFIWLLRAQNE